MNVTHETKRRVLTSLATALVAGGQVALATAAVPHLINMQGILRNSLGNPVGDSLYAVTFSIYDALSGGNALWTETQSIATNGGLFTVVLGSASLPPEVPDSVFADLGGGAGRWLGVKVGADPELIPREKLVAVGYAYRSEHVNSVNGAGGGRLTSPLSFGNGSTPELYIYESGSLNPARPILAHSPAFPNYGLSYDDAADQMTFEGAGSPVLAIALDGRFVAVNRNYQVSPAEYFGVHAPVGSGTYGGMYVSTNANGWPFYGYTNGSFISWQYLDDAGKWRFNHGGADRIVMTQGGGLGVGTSSPLGMIHTASGGGQAILSPAGGAGLFVGDVQVVGTLTKSAGSFKIDDPADPENKYLSHSFVESPDMKNIYDGIVVTDESGRADVTLPVWFGALNSDFRYQLTVIGSFARAVISREIADNSFGILTDIPNAKVSWQVTGIRKDAYANAHRIPVEEEKPASERGYYLHPELFGQPNGKGVVQALSAR